MSAPDLRGERAVATDGAPIIKSKHRVKNYGEVFTPPHMVNTMLDLVKDDLEFVDHTFLEPAAGDGNFLVAILKRKFRTVEKYYNPEFWGQEALFAVASVYGIELLADNHADAQAAMLEAAVAFHDAHKIRCGPRTLQYMAAKFLIEKNIIQGNTLTGKNVDGRPIEFSWWNRVKNFPGYVEREPFTLSSLAQSARDSDEGMLFSLADFAPVSHRTYLRCPINHVHKEMATP